MAIRRFFVSAFVVGSFVAYAVHERFVSTSPETTATSGAGTQAQNVLTSQQILPTVASPVPTAQPLIQNTQPQQIVPTNTPVPTAQPQPTVQGIFSSQVVSQPSPPAPTITPQNQAQYRDGVYTGPEVDAFYGLVEVQATVQNGRITDVQFLDYPHDRRTSQQINSIAMPYLTREAVQAQSAYVNVISGATLTSRAFAQSLYAALGQAAN